MKFFLIIMLGVVAFGCGDGNKADLSLIKEKDKEIASLNEEIHRLELRLKYMEKNLEDRERMVKVDNEIIEQRWEEFKEECENHYRIWDAVKGFNAMN